MINPPKIFNVKLAFIKALFMQRETTANGISSANKGSITGNTS